MISLNKKGLYPTKHRVNCKQEITKKLPMIVVQQDRENSFNISVPSQVKRQYIHNYRQSWILWLPLSFQVASGIIIILTFILKMETNVSLFQPCLFILTPTLFHIIIIEACKGNIGRWSKTFTIPSIMLKNGNQLQLGNMKKYSSLSLFNKVFLGTYNLISLHCKISLKTNYKILWAIQLTWLKEPMHMWDGHS